MWCTPQFLWIKYFHFGILKFLLIHHTIMIFVHTYIWLRLPIKAFPINFLWFGIIFPIQWPVKPVKSMAMRAVLRCYCPLAGHFVTCKVLVTSPNMWSRWVTTLKVKKMGFAGWSQAKRFRSSATSAGRSLWLVASCLRLGSRQMGSSTLRWEAPTSCSQRNLRLQLRIEMRRWCAKSQYMFFNWAPAKTVYEWGLRPYKRSRSSGNVSKEKCVCVCVRALWTKSWCRSVERMWRA